MRTSEDLIDHPITFVHDDPPHLFGELLLLNSELALERSEVLANGFLRCVTQILLE